MRKIGRELGEVFSPDASLSMPEGEKTERLNRSISGIKAVRESCQKIPGSPRNGPSLVSPTQPLTDSRKW